jgi:SPP1 gp7 family putative phage head morphogenesis protein
MSVNEDILDAITGHSVDLVRVEAGLRRKVVKDLKALESSVIKMLKNSGVAETINQKVKEKRLRKLLEQTRATIATSFKDISKESKKDLGSLANISAKQSVDAINGSLKASVASVGMSRSVLESISGNVLIEGAPSKEWWRRQSSQFQSEFSDVIRRGALLGKTTQEITEDFVGTQANNFKDGAAIRGRRRAEGLVRTSIQTVANEARQRTYAENEDIVKGIEWVSTLDSRTSNICKVLDGLVWDNNKKPIGHDKEYVGLTAHWNCRSTQVPVLKSWEELGGKKKYGEIPTSTRASMDGQVSASINYEDWLKSKSESFQKTALGLGKWELWKKGSLGFTDLIDQSGNEITLNELSERYGSTTKREGISYEDFINVTPEVEKVLSTYHLEDGLEDNTLKKLRDSRGFNELPTVLSKSQFDEFEGVSFDSKVDFSGLSIEEIEALRKKGVIKDFQVLYRGVTEAKFVDEFKRKGHYAGFGVHGNGTYSAISDEEYAKQYGKNVLKMKLKKDFNYITEEHLGDKKAVLFDDLNKVEEKLADIEYDKLVEMGKYKKDHRLRDSLPELNKGLKSISNKYESLIMEHEKKKEYLEVLVYDNGKLATVLGYDGIYVEGREFMVIQNRSKVVVME